MKFYCWTVAFLVPMALFENQTDRRLVSEVVGILLPTYDDVDIPRRWGMERAQGTFEHPILFGVFCAGAVSPAIYVWARNRGVVGKVMAALTMWVGTFTALSTGAYLAYGIQLILVFWDLATRKIRNRWRVLAGGFIFLYILIDLLSNRSPVQVFISYLTFNTGSSYNRVLIWRYGTQSVENNPLLGIGFNAWERAHWMSTSMDNFWLVVAVRYGLPALICMIWAFLWILIRVGRVDLRGDPRLEAVRKAYLMGVAGLFLSMCTVHLWNATYVYMVFLVGSGVWFLDHRFEDGDTPESDDEDQTGHRRGRRAPRQGRADRARPAGRTRGQSPRRPTT